MSSDKSNSHVVGGLKAALHNPNVSEEAKQHARERLEQVEGDASHHESEIHKISVASGKNEGNVAAGYKAALHNPRVSEEAKEHAREVLKENGDL